MSAAQWHENNNEACRSDATPAQVTEAHRELARTIRLHLTLGQAYQVIANSEARAVELLADRNYEVCAERDQLRTECNNLRAKSCQCAYDEACAHVLRAERAEDELLAVKMELDQVACARTDGILNESDLQCKLNMEREKSERAEAELANIRALADRRNKRDHSQDTTHQLVVALDQALDIAQAELAATKSTLDEEVNCAEKAEHEVVRQYARAERAEAKVSNQAERIRYLEGATNHATGTPLSIAIARAERAEAKLNESRYETVKAAQEGLRECIRAERAEAELAAERGKVRMLHSALQNLADEQNGAPLEMRREEWQEAMDEACAALAATEETK